MDMVTPDTSHEHDGFQTITVPFPELSAAVARIRSIGGVLLSYSARGDCYDLNFVLPDGAELEQQQEERP
jgi:hypothetical protein